jgi:hypothetical protein
MRRFELVQRAVADVTDLDAGTQEAPPSASHRACT